MAKASKNPGRSQHSLDKELAALVREQFILCYRQKAVALGDMHGRKWTPGIRWDGNPSHKGRQYQSIWARCAKVFPREQLPPAEYVHFVVFEVSPLRLPEPSALTSSDSIAAFNYDKKYERTNRLRRHVVQLEIQMAVLRADVGGYCEMMQVAKLSLEAIRQASLQNLELPLTPLFRYCVARREELQDLLNDKTLLVAAAHQYVCESSYLDEVWGDLIPEDFREQALAMFNL
jgi:hypothetical protein